MPVAVAGRSPLTFDLKSANLPLLALHLKSLDLGALSQELAATYGDSPNFFDDDAVLLDLSDLDSSHADTAIDFQSLGELLHAYRLRLIAVRGGSALQKEQAAEFGLLSLLDIQLQSIRIRQGDEVASFAEPAAVLPELGALVVERPLRSGQQVYARGRDLVLLDMVNSGAEVVADGHIHVYAPLRGRAIAGARGWTQARIFATEMQPELVSIAGVYRIIEAPLPSAVWGQTACVQLISEEAGDKLVFKSIIGSTR